MRVHHLIDFAKLYLVEDMPGSTILASRLQTILEKIHKNQSLTTLDLSYLRKLGLAALEQFASRKITHETFREVAALEQVQRVEITTAKQQAMHESMLAKVAEQEAYQAAYWAQQKAEQLARERDPAYIARQKNKALRVRYGIDGFVEQEHLSRLMNVLHRINEGNRFTDMDVVWLETEGKNYHSEILQTAFHEREAAFYVAEYRRTADPWNAVNASGHYRKCAEAMKARDLLASIAIERQKVPKLRSAIATTYGGVMRDLGHLDKALELGHLAYTNAPRDFRPCTLLGAVYFELNQYDSGYDWYDKAVERGATERSVDHDLRSIFRRADPGSREQIKIFLLRQDPNRYRWLNEQTAGARPIEKRAGENRYNTSKIHKQL